MMTKVRIPATSANLGVLFDKGGVALDAFQNTIGIEESDRFSFEISGLGAEYLPGNKQNLIYKSIEHFYKETGNPMPVFSLQANNGIPLSRGLGSSAACIAGGITAANLHEGEILNKKEIITMAADIEGHGDNVCAAVLGGFSIFSKEDTLVIPSGNDIGFILYIPETKLSTEKSRGVLPADYDYKTRKKAKNLENSMMKALFDMDYEKAGALMELDVIHQPYRKELLPYWDFVIALAKEAGVWGTGLSGAGPSMISFCNLKDMEKIIGRIKNSIDDSYKLNIIGSKLDTRGITRR